MYVQKSFALACKDIHMRRRLHAKKVIILHPNKMLSSYVNSIKDRCLEPLGKIFKMQAMEEYIIRQSLVVGEADLKNEIEAKLERVQQTMNIDVDILGMPSPITTWWHKFIALQPSGYVHNEELLRTALNLGTGVSDPFLSIRPGTVVIDWSDMTLLAILYKGSSMSGVLSPKLGIRAVTVKNRFHEKFQLLDEFYWTNFLFCLPMMIMAGLPPLTMLQLQPEDILVEGIRRTKSSIIENPSELKTVFEYLASREQSALETINDACKTLDRSVHTIVDVESFGWDQLRNRYYFVNDATLSEEAISKRAGAYIRGLFAIAEMFHGNLTTINIKMDDAPLAVDLVGATINEGVEEISSARRSFLRLYPIFG